jgi:hypothetical protein
LPHEKGAHTQLCCVSSDTTTMAGKPSWNAPKHLQLPEVQSPPTCNLERRCMESRVTNLRKCVIAPQKCPKHTDSKRYRCPQSRKEGRACRRRPDVDAQTTKKLNAILRNDLIRTVGISDTRIPNKTCEVGRHRPYPLDVVRARPKLQFPMVLAHPLFIELRKTLLGRLL